MDATKANTKDEINNLNNQLALARNECNRLRGVSGTELADDSGLDEKDKLIRSMEKELKNLREGIISLR